VFQELCLKLQELFNFKQNVPLFLIDLINDTLNAISSLALTPLISSSFPLRISNYASKLFIMEVNAAISVVREAIDVLVSDKS
jgi:hypothetical protein